jgi:hypothetical protein
MAFVRPVIFTGELLSTLSFFDGRAFVRFPLQTYGVTTSAVQDVEYGNISTFL